VSKVPWRLIPLLSATSRVQMALDTWLFEQHYQGLSPPVLRFYTWSLPAISLGYHQRHWPSTWKQLSWQGVPVELVRRPTGGRAVLHQGDLTYAVVASGLPGNRLQAYQTICEFLIHGWRSLGVELHYGQAKRNYIQNSNCFATATGADLLLADGSKLIGSAQLWRGSTVLQHGSMQLNPDPKLWMQVFGCSPEGTLGQQPIAEAQVIQSLISSATRCFDAQLQVQPLSSSEWQVVAAKASAMDQLF